MAPLISVIMPVYNCENYVYQAIESILNQTEGNFELLVIDDASTDGTVQVINTITDDRLQLITKPKNTGYTHSLNMGLELAKGKYIARMDGDDISLPTRFEKQLAAFNQNPNLVVCGTWFSLFGAEQRNIEHPVNHADIQLGLLQYCCIGHPTVMIRKEKFTAHQLRYDPRQEPAEDYNLWTRLIAKGEFCNIPEVLLHYRIHASSVSKTRVAAQQASAAQARLTMFSYAAELTQEERQLVLMCFINNKGSSATAIQKLLPVVSKLTESPNFYINKRKFTHTIQQQLNHFCKFFLKDVSHNKWQRVQALRTIWLSQLFTLRQKLFYFKQFMS